MCTITTQKILTSECLFLYKHMNRQFNKKVVLNEEMIFHVLSKLKKDIIACGMFILCILFASCHQQTYNELDCLGTWEMLEDSNKTFVLKKNGSVEFHNLSFMDIAGMEWESTNVAENILDVGRWKIETEKVYRIEVRQSIVLWVKRDSMNIYGFDGKLTQEGTELQLWFSVGDPDDYEWKRFRLVKPDN